MQGSGRTETVCARECEACLVEGALEEEVHPMTTDNLPCFLLCAMPISRRLHHL